MITSTNWRDDRLRGFSIQLAVKGNDAAERGGRAGFVSAIVGVKNRVADGNAARLACLTITQAGSLNSFYTPSAASVSARC